jgi:hypothetical protein
MRSQIFWSKPFFDSDKDLSTRKARFEKPAPKVVTAVRLAAAAGEEEKQPLTATSRDKPPPDDGDVKMADGEKPEEKEVMQQQEHGYLRSRRPAAGFFRATW